MNIINGYIPIIDLSSHPNVYNSFNITTPNKNPWEIFFNQPFGYTLDNVKKYGKNIKYIICSYNYYQWPNTLIYYNNYLLDFWHNFAKNYLPIKEEIINEAIAKKKYLFKGSNNILGVLVRGTDYRAMKPSGHSIQPNIDIIFKDIQNMHIKNYYDWIFITTEDEIIREKFIRKFGKKLKFIKSPTNIEYNITKKQYLNYNINLKGNVQFFKIYLINIIILSKCLDIICPLTGGAKGAFLFSEGFRNKIIYNLGKYK